MASKGTFATLPVTIPGHVQAPGGYGLALSFGVFTMVTHRKTIGKP